MPDIFFSDHAIERWTQRFPELSLEAAVQRSVLKAVDSRGERWLDQQTGAVFCVSKVHGRYLVMTVLDSKTRGKSKMVKIVRNCRKKRKRDAAG